MAPIHVNLLSCHLQLQAPRVPSASSVVEWVTICLFSSILIYSLLFFSPFISPSLTVPLPSQIASPRPFSSTICLSRCSISRLKLQSLEDFQLQRSGGSSSRRRVLTERWKKDHVNCREKSRNLVFLLLSRASRDYGGTFDVWRFHSFLLWLFHILISLVCAVVLFLFLSSICHFESNKEAKNFPFRSWASAAFSSAGLTPFDLSFILLLIALIHISISPPEVACLVLAWGSNLLDNYLPNYPFF